MNTYRLEPKENERYLSFLYSFRFYPSKIKEIIKRETEKVMEKEKEFLIKYSDDAAKRIAAEVSEQVRNAIKPTGEDAVIPRHKLIVQSVVGERGGQGLKVTSKSLWHSEFDNSATYVYETVNKIIMY